MPDCQEGGGPAGPLRAQSFSERGSGSPASGYRAKVGNTATIPARRRSETSDIAGVVRIQR